MNTGSVYYKTRITWLFILLPACFGCGNNSQDRISPNIIIMLADDLGYGDLACYGSSIQKTPNLDRMAREGLRFTDFHSNSPVCSPTRASLLTGLYPQRVGIEGVVNARKFRHTGLSSDAFTMADYMKLQGYRTGLIGKWHLGYDTLYSPLNAGFDYFKGYVSGNIDYHSHLDATGAYDWWEQKDTLAEPGYTTDLITENALGFIRDNRDEPFFLLIAHETPHSPYQGRKDRAIRTPGSAMQETNSEADSKATYAEMISILDEGAGKIMDALEKFGLLENTVVLFLSDNGATPVGSNEPFRGFKGSLWEGGHRVPAMAYWKGKIKPGTSDELLLGMDIFPTLATLVGQKMPGNHQPDGTDFSSVLLEHASLPGRTVFWRYQKSIAVRTDPWKYLVAGDSSYLFNLTEDPSEQINLVSREKKLSDSLRILLETWEKEMSEYELRTY